MGWPSQLSYIKKINSYWDKFVSSGSSEGIDVRPDILQSWQRSYQNGVAHLRLEAPTELSPDQLEQERQANTHLIAAAIPILDDLAQLLHGSGQVLLLTNARTTIIEMRADSLGFKRATELNLKPGSNISEASRGTTAPGLATLEHRPFTVFAAEHYCEAPKKWSCTSAPILPAVGQTLQGTLTLAGRYMIPHNHSPGLILSAARVIEERLLQQYWQYRSEVLLAYTESSLRMRADLIVATDHYGNVLEASTYHHPLLLEHQASLSMIPEVQVGIQRLLNNPDLARSQMDRVEAPLVKRKYQLTYRSIIKNSTFYGLLLFAHSSSDHRSNQRSVSTSLGKPLSNQHPAGNMPPAHALVGSAPAFQHALNLALRAATSNAVILLEGETGAGKEGFARAIHHASSQQYGPFVAVNCGAIPKELIASELFGYAPGAFTGASQQGHSGKFEAANGGTLFLDEVSELPLEMQTYLLRVLQEREVIRLGSHQPTPVNIRLVSATQRNLAQCVAEGYFREDLYYRLNIIEIKIPSLRERPEDLPYLIMHFLNTFGCPNLSIQEETLHALQSYAWPGNVRELMNVVERSTVLGPDIDAVFLEYVQSRTTAVAAKTESPQQDLFNGDRIAQTLAVHDGNVTLAARKLGVARSTIYRYLKENQLTLNRHLQSPD
ncbi:MAG: sigma-54-dependent Fis family transcriptional regulator [Peptococcaceae bacterium]|jgi:transcriptional regulator of acetoin/glycerol metabolism|nr:sigma-54-dependent Fis family transcriptional regulator [Peptococcaceae bacterium]